MNTELPRKPCPSDVSEDERALVAPSDVDDQGRTPVIVFVAWAVQWHPLDRACRRSL